MSSNANKEHRVDEYESARDLSGELAPGYQSKIASGGRKFTCGTRVLFKKVLRRAKKTTSRSRRCRAGVELYLCSHDLYALPIAAAA
eukprot:scaffold468_cov133-Skeletonema_menzelii.AAC.5